MKYIFHIKGLHCKACVMMTESEVMEVPNVTETKTSLALNTIEVTGDFGAQTPEEIAQILSEKLAKSGYSVSVEKGASSVKWSEFKVAVPVAFAFAVIFVALQKLGIVNLVDASRMSYGTAFAIGVIASLSTCMAVVGGLVLSMSATFAKEGDRVRPQVMFHVGRMVSFFVLGGVIGSIGAVFTLKPSLMSAMSLIVGLVMLVLGVNLLDVFPWAKKFQMSMPKKVGAKALTVASMSHSVTPLLVGLATFFLPCGFTQSMQIYTLGTGSFLKGGLTMLMFALGTLPVLALIGFSSFSIKESGASGIFFKSAGLIVILFALFNILNSLVVIGLIPPLFNF